MNKDKQVIHKLKCISMISLLFMTVEIVGGIMANSIAILADAFHLLSDVLAYIISLQAVLMSHKVPPFFMTFGYEKVQPLGALVNVAIIWFVTLQLVVQATQRIVNKSVVKDPLYMLLTSIFGLGCNLYIMRVLHSDTQHGGHQGCSHSHGLQHHHEHDNKELVQHHNHKHGSSCNHSHSKKATVKKQSKQKCNHGNHGKHNHNHSHDHDHEKEKQTHHDCHNHQHGHGHDHNHKHQNITDHSHQADYKNQHLHEHGQNCEHSHDKQKGKISSHKHDQSCKDSCDSFRQLNSFEQQKNSVTVSSLKEQVNQDPMSQQILQHHISYKPDVPQLNMSDQNMKLIIQKQRARKQLFNNINIQAAYIHILSDIILSIGVIISAVIICMFADRQEWTAWQLADPLCTYLFSVMAIYSTVGIAKDSVIILLDGCDDKAMLKQIIGELDNMKQIQQYQQLRVWSLNRAKFAAAVKIYLRKQQFQNSQTRDKIRNQVVGLFSNRGISHYVEISEQSEKIANQQ